MIQLFSNLGDKTFLDKKLEIPFIVRDYLDCVGKVPVSGVSRDAGCFATSEMLTKNIRRCLLFQCVFESPINGDRNFYDSLLLTIRVPRFALKLLII